MDWPIVVLILGLTLFASATFGESRRRKYKIGREDDLMKLVQRYEQLAEKTMDAEQRVATDVAELRARTAAIEQILRSVE